MYPRLIVGTEKFCSGCEQTKPVSAFAKNSEKSYGLQVKCRECKAQYYQSNKERHGALTAAWQRRNPIRQRQFGQKWRDANREAMRARDARRAKERPDLACAKAAKRRAVSSKATPAWANLDAIKAIYAKARSKSIETGMKWHVDHIVPLQSPVVCGLHVEHNLQLLTALDNVRKHNKQWPDMPEAAWN